MLADPLDTCLFVVELVGLRAKLLKSSDESVSQLGRYHVGSQRQGEHSQDALGRHRLETMSATEFQAPIGPEAFGDLFMHVSDRGVLEEHEDEEFHSLVRADEQSR